MYGKREAARRRLWEEEARVQEVRIMGKWTEKVNLLHQEMCGGPVEVDWQPRGFVKVRAQAPFLESPAFQKLEEELDHTIHEMWMDLDRHF